MKKLIQVNWSSPTKEMEKAFLDFCAGISADGFKFVRLRVYPDDGYEVSEYEYRTP